MTMNDQASNAPTPRYLWWTLALSAAFATTAVIAAPFVGIQLNGGVFGRAGEVGWLTLAAGTFLSGCLVIWALMSAPRRFSVMRGGVVGGLTTLVSYPVVQLLTDVASGNAPDGAAWAKFTGLALLATGPMAIVVGVVVGMAASWMLIRGHKGTAAIVAARAARSLDKVILRLLFALGAVIVVLLLCLTASLVWLTFKPMNLNGLVALPGTPAANYDASIAAYDGIRAQEAGMGLHERCPTTLLTHGSKVERVVVYFHGLTSCPAQGDALAQTLFEQGYNVYLPRMYGHGLADPLTTEPESMQAETMIADASQAVDIAQGLGAQVVIVGLSAGGTNVSWLAQNRDDIDLAIGVSPFLGPHVVPSWAARAFANLLLMLPNQWVWWNPLETVRPPESNYAYARWSSHALAQVIRLGAAVAQQADRSVPLSGNISVVLNAADVAVNADLVEGVIASWRKNGATVDEQTLPFALHLPHDLIDPREPGGDVEYFYPIIMEMIAGSNG